MAHANPPDREINPPDREIEKKFNQQGVETSVIRTDGRAGRRVIQVRVRFPEVVTVVRSRSSLLITTPNAGREVLMCWSTPFVSGPRRNRKPACPLTVRFEATNGLEVTPVFGVRLVRR